MMEKLPVPFGLIRYGVAPDHQGTKGAARVLERTLSRDRVRFFGNVEVGRDVTLTNSSDVPRCGMATGAPRDRKLGVPGEELPGVMARARLSAGITGTRPARAPSAACARR